MELERMQPLNGCGQCSEFNTTKDVHSSRAAHSDTSPKCQDRLALRSFPGCHCEAVVILRCETT